MTLAILLALAPTGLLIGFGAALRRTNFLKPAFFADAERLSYFVLLPSLFVHGLATADMSKVAIGRFALVLITSLLAGSAVLILVGRRLVANGPAFTSVFQGGIRFNNYVGLTAAIGLFGSAGVTLSALANAVIVPTVNVLCILVFAAFGDARPTLAGILRSVVTNPLILGCAIGGAFQASGLPLPPGIDASLKALGQAALPIGLICVGAALDLEAFRGGRRNALLAMAAKFLMLPLVTFTACVIFGLGGEAAIVALLFQALPTASSSYILARQLGGDAGLMAAIIAVETIIAAVTLPLTLILAALWFAG